MKTLKLDSAYCCLLKDKKEDAEKAELQMEIKFLREKISELKAEKIRGLDKLIKKEDDSYVD